MPWGDGFLHLEYAAPTTSEEPCSEGRLSARFSTDGVEWTEFSDLEVPSVHTKPTLLSQLGLDDLDCLVNTYKSAMRISSDGERFVIASQWPTYLDTWYGRRASDAAWLDRLLENPPSVSVSITRDLVNWETIEVPIPRPEGLHTSLHAAPSLGGLSLAEQGWLLELETVTYMNLFSLMPADIRESASRIQPKYDGPWVDESTGESGMTVEWWADGTQRDAHTRFVPWRELGTTRELYEDYGEIVNKPYHPEWRYSGSMLVAPWGESPERFDLPYVHTCCTVWTESGFVGLLDHSVAGHLPSLFGPATVVFSPDAETWDALESIGGERTWVKGIAAVNSGVIAFSTHPDEFLSLGGDQDRIVYWLSDPDGSNWRQVEPAETTDPIEWLMANDRTPIDWPRLAVNGNVVLRIRDYTIERYVAPG